MIAQSSSSSGRKRPRSVDEESQLFHPASKKEDSNPNRDLLGLSALSIHASNGVNLTNGVNHQVIPPQHQLEASSSSNSPHCSSHQPPQNIPLFRLPSQAIPNCPSAPSTQIMEQPDQDSDDEPSTPTIYTNINMVYKTGAL
ncbi:hypothetical protein BSL78_12507 [Apostichopus japonicus]|uniref:Uncharacterized protein n=1 Tax=Stichopus japonicus TaxID=307972 RepID=A0A2G8KRH0_STIJA|nr:hypothetical protein BSL78_12507 [Apostichopus japonicus]